MKQAKKIIIIFLLTLSTISLTIGVYWYKINVIQPQAEIDTDRWYNFDISVFEGYNIEVFPLKTKWSSVPLVLSYSNILFFAQIAHELNITKVYYKFGDTLTISGLFMLELDMNIVNNLVGESMSYVN